MEQQHRAGKDPKNKSSGGHASAQQSDNQKDSSAIPKISDLNDSLAGAVWLSSMDCCSAYHQIPLADERSKDLTSFSIPGGGLVNSPATWCRFIDTVLCQYRWDFVLTYMDDLLVFTRGSIDDHISHLKKVFDRLRSFGINLKASKLKLRRKDLPYLGMLVDINGFRPDPEKPKAVTTLPFPTTMYDLRRVL